jgi:hypothetical protein
MNRRALLYLSLIVLAGCKVGDNLRGGSVPLSAPGFAIRDGAHLGTGSNPDFFFLPPMVPDPSGSPNFNAGAFNPNLKPTVKICELVEATPAAVNTGPPVGGNCKTGGYALSVQINAPSLPDELYQYNWAVPVSPLGFYKIEVLVGAKSLGFADVQTADNSSKLKNVNTGDFVPLNNGRTLPIKVRIERYALCEVPGTGPCTSQVVDLSTGGTVSTTLPGGTAPSGVIIPPQGNAGQPVITVESCLDLNDRATDLPTFGKCVRITSDPPLPPAGLTTAATIFICDLSFPAGGGVASEAQEKRITLHRLDPGPIVTALPHVAGCPVNTASNASLSGLFKALAHGNWKSAGSQALGLLSPKPLYAFRRIDQGGGGRSDDFSDFQFALPAKMEKVAGDNQTGVPGAVLAIQPKVLVTDLGGEPVKGARVTFTPTDGSVLPTTPVITGVDGTAQVGWTLKSTPGANSLAASGRGLAGSDANGPRDGVDPFQPIQPPFDPATVGGAVTVLTGSQTFAATGAAGFDFGSGGWEFVVIPTTDVPDNFPAGDFGGTAGGVAAFGSSEGPCANLKSRIPAQSQWPLNTDILLRKTFSAPAGTITITVQIDNDVEVFLDHNQITEGFRTHEGCADVNPLVFTVPIGAGIHTLAIHGRDRGVESFIDVKVSFAPPAPSGGN